MKNMKALLTGFVVLSLSLAGCGQTPTSTPANESTPASEAPVSEQPSVTPSTPAASTPEEQDVVITSVTFEGLDDLVVNRGDAKNAKEGVKAIANYTENGTAKTFIITSYVSVKQGDEAITGNVNTQEVGEYTLTYTVDTARVVGFTFASDCTLTATRKLTVNAVQVSTEELITNGDFSQGDAGWGSYTDGSMVEITYDKGYMECVQSAISPNSYSPRINTTYPKSGAEFTLVSGQTYLVSMDLWASANKTICVQLGTLLSGSPYWNSLEDTDGNQLLHTFNVTTERKTYTWEFTLASATCQETHMTIEMGTVNGDATVATVCVDDVSVKAEADDGTDKVGPQITAGNVRLGYDAEATEAIDVLDGVVVKDNKDEHPTVVATIKDSEGNAVEKITLANKGEYTVTVKATDESGNETEKTFTIKIVDEQVLGTDFGTVTALVNGGESDTLPGQWTYWRVEDASWGCGEVITATNTFEDGKLTISTSGLAANVNNWSSQLFYKTVEVAAGTYKVSVKVTSDIARKVKLNGEVYELVAGENTVSFNSTLAEAGHVAISAQLGGADLTTADASTLTFENLSVVYLGKNLVQPTALVDGEEASAQPGNWTYWRVQDASWGCGEVITANNTFEEGVLTVSVSGLAANVNNWSSQLFYKTEETAAGTYVLTFDVNSDVARKILVCTQSVELTAGDNHVSVEVTNADFGAMSIAMQLGGADLTTEDTSVLKFSNPSLLYKG